MNVVEELKDFALRGSVLDLAVGFTVGAAFTGIARSLVDDIVMPIVAIFLGRVQFQDLYVVLRAPEDALPAGATLEQARIAGALTLNYGQFLNHVVAFVFVTIAMFLFIRAINRLDRELDTRLGSETPDNAGHKKCPYCMSVIPAAATVCAHCTYELEEETNAA